MSGRMSLSVLIMRSKDEDEKDASLGKLRISLVIFRVSTHLGPKNPSLRFSFAQVSSSRVPK